MQPLIQFCHQCQSSHPPGQHKARPASKPDPVIAEIARRRVDQSVKQVVDQVAHRLMTQPMNAANPSLLGKSVPNRAKKPAKAKKKATKPSVDRPAAIVLPKDPKKMTRDELEALVAAVIAKDEHKRRLKAKYQMTWRAKPKKAKRRGR